MKQELCRQKMMYRQTFSEINIDAFKSNHEKIRTFVDKAIFSVCKANAYSHGDYPIAKAAMEAGSAYVCVSSFDEAIRLRQQGFDGNLLILGYVHPSCLASVIEYAITITVFSYDWLTLIPIDIDYSKLKVHIKVDTGMNRIGFKQLDEIQRSMQWFEKHDINVEGIYTHLHSADQEDKGSAIKQLNWFYAVVDALQYPFVWVHTENSDATLSIDDTRSNAVRVGLALYGISSVAHPLQLEPVLSLYSHIVHCKEVRKGESVGYGATYICKQDSYIATLPIGYGDGFLRANQGRYVCVETYAAEIVGRICMDQTMILVDQPYAVNTKVEIIGKHSPLIKMAKELQMIPYEVLCLLNDRITKIIKENNQIIAIINNRMIFEDK